MLNFKMTQNAPELMHAYGYNDSKGDLRPPQGFQINNEKFHEQLKRLKGN